MMIVSVCIHGVGVPVEMTTETKFLAYGLLEFVFTCSLTYDLLLLLLMMMMIVRL